MNFTAGVYYDGEMRMNNYNLGLSMITNTTDGIKYFVYSCMDSTIFINAEHVKTCQSFVDSGLKVSTVPGEPVDQLIGLMFYYKLNAIMEDRIVLEETEISSMLGENMVYLHSENETTDIATMPDWWNNADPSYNDFMSTDARKVLSIQPNMIWRELNLIWPEAVQKEETGNIVVFADFKPNNETK